ncbi:MAG TPA: hypothetical protein VMV27_13980 [Candidatus Binataceae bacterium]|nr:hypothetical protein [Candidatus Binataceae bacterium]
MTQLLIPPPATPAVRLSSTPQSYTVSGGANAAAAFSVIPKIYGARRIFPQYAASAYTELVGHDQYLRMLFLLGYGPLDISQIQIGDTAIEDYEDVEWELRAGFTDDAPSRLYPGSVAESDINIELSKSNVGSAPTVYGWSVTQTSGPLADELSVDISFPGGLVAFSSLNGSPIHIQCTWQIQWQPVGGSGTWNSEPDLVINFHGRESHGGSHGLGSRVVAKNPYHGAVLPSRLARGRNHCFLPGCPSAARRQVFGTRLRTLSREWPPWIPVTGDGALPPRGIRTQVVALAFPADQFMSPLSLPLSGDLRRS